MTTTTVPIHVTPEAAARVAELGMQAELDRMLEHTRQTVPGLRSIEVQLALPYDTGDDTTIIIQPTSDVPFRPDDPIQREWDEWQMNTFSPDIYRHFILMPHYGTAHDG